MANSTENRINTSIAAADVTAIEKGFTDIGTALDNYTQALTDDERASLFSLQDANLVFAADALAQGQTLMAKLPPAMQALVTNMVKDMALEAQLDTFAKNQLAQLTQRILDTKRLAAHESYVGALALYKVIEAMAATGIEGFQAAYDVLKVRFASQGGGKPLGTNP